MFDLHCHFLPGIDDGPETLDQALGLAKLAVANGITHSVVTPHVHLGRYENTKASIHEVFQNFKQALTEHDITLNVAYAGEVRLGAEILELVLSQQIPYLGRWQNHDVLLLEFPHSHIPPGADKLVDWLLKQNVLPMIAHPERNKDVMRSFDKITPFIERGCLFQLTAGSVAGKFGENAHNRAIELLETGKMTILASDAHNIDHRPPVLLEGLEVAKTVLGEDAIKLVLDNPRTISQELF